MDRFTDYYGRHGLWSALALVLRRQLVAYALLGLGLVVASTAVPLLIERTLAGHLTYGLLVATAVAVMGQSLMRWLSTWLIRVLVYRTHMLINRLLFRRLSRVDPAWLRAHDRSTSAYLQTWPDQVSQIVFAAQFVVYAALTIALCGYIVLSFGLTGVLTIVSALVVASVLHKLVSRSASVVQSYFDIEHARSNVIDMLVGSWQSVRRQHLEPQVITRLFATRSRQRAALGRRAWYAAAVTGFTEMLPLLVVVPVLLVRPGVNLGGGVALLVAVRMLLSALGTNMDLYGDLRSGLVARHGIDELLAEAPTVADTEDADDGIRIVCDDAVYHFPDGACVAIVASTSDLGRQLVESIAGMQSPDRFKGSSGPSVALVARNQPTFDGSIAEVVTAYAEDVDESRYRQALLLSGLFDDLAARPLGDAAPLSSSTVRLSEGQLVRVALAQALYHQPRTLLLDDIFAPLDPRMAALIATLLFEGSDLPSRVVATTDWTTARRATQIIVLGPTRSMLVEPAELSNEVVRSRVAETLRVPVEKPTPMTVEPPSRPDWESIRQFRFGTAPELSAETMEDATGSTQSGVSGLRSVRSLYPAGVLPLIGLLALVGWAAEVLFADRMSGAASTAAIILLCSVALCGLLATYLRALATARASVTQTEWLHRFLLVRLLSGALDQRTSSIAGRVGRDFVNVEMYAGLSNVAVAVALLQTAAGLALIAVLTPAAALPVIVIAVLGWLSHRGSQRATRNAMVSTSALRGPSFNLAIAVIGARPYHLPGTLSRAISARFDQVTARRIVAMDQLMRVRLRSLLEIEVLASAVPIFALVAATMFGSALRAALGVLVYVAYSFVDRFVSVISQVQGTGTVLAAAGRLADTAGRVSLPNRHELRAGPSTEGDLYDMVVKVGSQIPAEETSIVCAALTVELPDGRLLPPLDWEIRAPSFVVLTGPSGVGKSTVLQVIAGAIEPAAGMVRTVGLTPDWLARPTRDVVSVAESDLPAVAMSVEKTISPWHTTSAELDALATLLTAAQLPNLAPEADMAKLSRGHRQIVNLARALAEQPRILLLDEATSALSVAAERAVLLEVGRRMSHGVVLAVLHRRDNQDLADHICDLNADTVAVSAGSTSLVTVWKA